MIPRLRIVGLGGGIGASRLWTVMAAALPPDELTIVANVADDIWMYGLRVCPDIDSVLYAMAGLADTDRGWGIGDESFVCMDTLRVLGEDVWFNLGDRDLATHLMRTALLCQGKPLDEITTELAAMMGVRNRVMPVTNDPVRTTVRLQDGVSIDYQEYLVRHGTCPPISDVEWLGLGEARPAPGLVDLLETAALIVIGPSNPLASVHPILGVAGVRDAIARSPARVVGVTPVVSAIPIDDEGERRRARSRAALLATRGYEHRSSHVASMYRDLLDAFVVDPADGLEADAVAELGIRPIVVDTLVHRHRSTGTPPLVDYLLAEASTPPQRGRDR